MLPTDLDPLARAALVETVARLKHDLGKYVCFQTRWLADDAPLAEVREALAADLVATRRGPEGTSSAPDVWAALRPALVGEAPLPGGARTDLSRHPDVARIDAAMVVIAAAVARLRDDTLDATTAREAARAARDVSDACRDLARAVREQTP